jgi:rhodanese-related sulfurtransferase
MKMQHTLRRTLIIAAAVSAQLLAYDAELAKEMDKTFSRMTQKALAACTAKISGDDVMEMIRKGEKFVLLDIRTPGEKRVLRIAAPQTLEIPLNKLFKKENLDKLPKDKPIVIVCHSGSRAQQAAVSLRMLGFTNVQVLNGGLKAFAEAASLKNAPLQP